MSRDLINSDEVWDFSEEQRVDERDDVPEQMSEHEWEEFLTTARESLLTKDQIKKLQEREKATKSVLMDRLDRFGSRDAKGHNVIDLPTKIRGYVRLVRQRKVTTTVDLTEAEAIARAKGLYDRLFVSVPTLDEDAVMVAVREGKITDAELAKIFVKKVSYAFVPEKEKK